MVRKRAKNSKAAKVAVLDAGSQFGGLIDRNVRELGLRTVLLPLETPAEELVKYEAIIISGGPKSVEDKDAHFCDPKLFTLDIPILGICYGMQLMAKMRGGRVGPSHLRQDGPQLTSTEGASNLFEGLSGQQKVLMSHGDSVHDLPEGFRIVATSGQLTAAIEDPVRRHYGVQFHPEVFQTENGPDIFRNFLFNISELTPDYTAEDQEKEALNYIQETVGEKDVVVLVSGGVDSAVLAALVAKSIKKDKVHAFHVDTGFMRARESQDVIEALAQAGIVVNLLDMAEMFYNATTTIDGVETPPLSAVTDPQMKRKIIGDTFMKVNTGILKQRALGEDTVLAQGSLRPDLIESGSLLASSKADTIKTHHNDTEEVRKLRALGRVVEPLQQLYKDQVRVLGRRLGLPPHIVDRHPFPGPGGAIRILCAESAFKMPDHNQLQASLDEFLQAEGYREYKAHLLPVRTVGVQGDGRSYKYLVGLEGKPDWVRLYELAATIPDHNHAANRVSYIFGEPMDRTSLNITPTHLTKDVMEQWRRADAVVTQVLREHDLMDNISQMPVILLPLNFGKAGARGVALRPFVSPDFMTGIAARPGNEIPEVAIQEMVNRILKSVPNISRVLLDLSSKPPGTTEWE